MIARSRYYLSPSLLRLLLLVILLLLFCSDQFILLAETLQPTLASRPPMDLEERSNHNRGDDDDNDDRDPAIWDPVAQIYKSGRVPENANVRQMIETNGGVLRLFGYGSLCWNPGTPGASALAHASVTSSAGRCHGYRRCWAQKSTDHRGWPHFPGIVCTLLTEVEFQSFFQEQYENTSSSNSSNSNPQKASFTEGLIYKVPPELVQECLAELDFREKGVRTSMM